MTKQAVRKAIDEISLESLLGLNSSKIGFYSDVKQKIQELEAANSGLRHKSNELQALFNSIVDTVIVYDSHGLVQHRNHVAPIFFSQQTMTGKSCRELFHPETPSAKDSCPVEKALAGESVELSFTTSLANGSLRYFDVSATPIDDVDRASRRALLFLRDVSEKRLQELHLIQAEKLSSIGILAAGVAHELNNPLASVAGYAEALLRRLKDLPELDGDDRFTDFHKYLGVIISESYRCKRIIDCLLSFSRKSDGGASDVDINEVFSETVELVRYKSRYEKIKINTDFQENLPPVLCEPSALRQVVMNLLINAHQAIAGPGVIDIATKTKDNGWVIFTIRDSGCGIPSEMLEQIWDPFFTTKVAGKGLGLGLAITYNIIKKYGGDITVKSNVDSGTLFTVRMPACQK